MILDPQVAPGSSGSSFAVAPRVAARATHGYAAFGGVLCSELEFPELTPRVCDRVDWTLRVSNEAPPAVALEPIGERQLAIERYRLARSPSGLRLEYSHAGAFDISADGTEIVWYRRPDAQLELVRAIALGSVLALALELAGLLCLHGSAVAIGGRAVAFVGPKHHGKSTLATALTAAGARLIGDDLLAIAPGPPALVRPGVASVRLWSDTARALEIESLCGHVISGVKTTAAGFAERALVQTPTALAAVYVLEPVHREAQETAATRHRLNAVPAAIALALQTKLADSLVGLRAAGGQLTAAAALAATVPVYQLRAVRDFALLPALVAQVFEWHQEDV